MNARRGHANECFPTSHRGPRRRGLLRGRRCSTPSLLGALGGGGQPRVWPCLAWGSGEHGKTMEGTMSRPPVVLFYHFFFGWEGSPEIEYAE